MKNQKTVFVIAVLVIVFSVICSVLPLITKGELTDKTMISTLGETVTLYGKGLYARNSRSSAVQAIAQDLVTLFMVVPGMILSLVWIKKKKISGMILLTGMFGYMLYTYMSYAFLMFYNELFLLYVANMALSFYGTVLCIMDLSENSVIEDITKDMPAKGIRIFLLVSGVMISLMWLGRIFPTLVNPDKGVVPADFGNAVTLVIQAMDLGIIVPACFVIAHLLKIRHKLGYILGPVIIVKAVTLVTAVLMMAVFLHISGEGDETASFMVFGAICIMSFFYFFRVMKHFTAYDRA